MLLLERTEQLGGAARWSGGLILFSGTAAQQAQGIEDSSTALLSDWGDATGGDPEDPWVRAFAEGNVPLVHDWLVDLGLAFELAPEGSGELAATRRLHKPTTGGAGLVGALSDGLDASQVVLGADVEAILVDQAGAAQGVRYLDASGEAHELFAHRTVWATGSFLRDQAQVLANRGELQDVELAMGSGPQADGVGHRLLLERGACWDNPQAINLYVHAVLDPRDGGEGEELLVPTRLQGIWIDSQGLRFHDERVSNSMAIAETALRVGEPPFWLVLDAQRMGAFELKDAMVLEDEGELPTSDDLRASGQLFEEDSLEALAAAAGIDATGLDATVAAFNAWTRGEGDDPYRDDPVLPQALDQPPFTALRFAVTASKAFTGLEVDGEGHLLDAAGQPVPGLLAAGELTGMAGGSLVGDLGFNGSFSAVILSGRLAGAAAAREALAAR